MTPALAFVPQFALDDEAVCVRLSNHVPPSRSIQHPQQTNAQRQ